MAVADQTNTALVAAVDAHLATGKADSKDLARKVKAAIVKLPAGDPALEELTERVDALEAELEPTPEPEPEPTPEPEPVPPADVFDPTRVMPPIRPVRPDVPAGAVRVETSAALRTELAKAPHDIVLEGSFTGEWANPGANRLWAGTRGAELLFGLYVDRPGFESHGIDYHCVDPAKTAPKWDGRYSAAIVTTGDGKRMAITDADFGSNFKLDWGVLAYARAGLVLERLTGGGYRNGGIYTAPPGGVVRVPYGQAVDKAKRIQDVDFAGFSHERPGASNQYEGALFLGCPVEERPTRLRFRDCARKCFEAFYDARDTVLTHLDFDPSGPHGYGELACYLEHYAYGMAFEDFVFRAGRGFNAEWGASNAESAMGGYPAILRRGLIDATGRGNPIFAGNGTVGVYVDQRNPGVRLEDVTFRGQTRAAVNDSPQVVSISTWDAKCEFLNVSRQYLSLNWTAAP